MDLTALFLHGLVGLLPCIGLTVLILAVWAWRRPRPAPRLGWLGATLVLLAGGVLSQLVPLLWWRWPDGSMAGYGVLILVMAVLQSLLSPSGTRLS